MVSLYFEARSIRTYNLNLIFLYVLALSLEQKDAHMKGTIPTVSL